MNSFFRNSFLIFLFFAICLFGKNLFAQSEGPQTFWQQDLQEPEADVPRKVGLASWYGGKFHGRKTASGERYNKHDLTCASRHLPFGTLLKVTNLANGKTAIVRVNDRGPFVTQRVLDFSRGVAEKLDFLRSGVTQVAYTIISPDSSN